MSIKDAFDHGAKSYDIARKQLIPCFDEFYGVALKLVPFQPEESIKILDLGAGTGLLSALLMHKYPNAEFTLLDVSVKMLGEAKNRFKSTSVKINYECVDYASEPIKGEYDLVVSALSIHHLSCIEKEELFGKIYHCLNSNGVFINADQVLGDTPDIESQYRSVWLEQVKDKGVSDASLSSALERMKEDKMSSLPNQLAWLRKANFSNINCWYQNYSFVVYSGNK